MVALGNMDSRVGSTGSRGVAHAGMVAPSLVASTTAMPEAGPAETMSSHLDSTGRQCLWVCCVTNTRTYVHCISCLCAYCVLPVVVEVALPEVAAKGRLGGLLA